MNIHVSVDMTTIATVIAIVHEVMKVGIGTAVFVRRRCNRFRRRVVIIPCGVFVRRRRRRYQ